MNPHPRVRREETSLMIKVDFIAIFYTWIFLECPFHIILDNSCLLTLCNLLWRQSISPKVGFFRQKSAHLLKTVITAITIVFFYLLFTPQLRYNFQLDLFILLLLPCWCRVEEIVFILLQFLKSIPAHAEAWYMFTKVLRHTVLNSSFRNDIHPLFLLESQSHLLNLSLFRGKIVGSRV